MTPYYFLPSVLVLLLLCLLPVEMMFLSWHDDVLPRCNKRQKFVYCFRPLLIQPEIKRIPTCRRPLDVPTGPCESSQI